MFAFVIIALTIIALCTIGTGFFAIDTIRTLRANDKRMEKLIQTVRSAA